MPAEQVADSRPGHALAAGVLEGAQDVVGDVVAQARPEDVGGGDLGVFPDSQGSLDVGQIDISRAVERRVEECQSYALRLGPGGPRAKKPRPSRRQLRINLFPGFRPALGPADAADTRGGGDRRLEAISETGNHLVPQSVAPEGKDLRSFDEREQAAISESVSGVGAGTPR